MATIQDNEWWGSLPYGRVPTTQPQQQTRIPYAQTSFGSVPIYTKQEQEQTNKAGQAVGQAYSRFMEVQNPTAKSAYESAVDIAPKAVKPTTTVPSATVSPLVTQAAYGTKQPLYEGYVQTLDKMRQGQPGAQIPPYMAKANERPMPAKVEQPVTEPKAQVAPVQQERPAWMKESDVRLSDLEKRRAQLAKQANDLSISPAVRREARLQLQETNAMDRQERQNRFQFEVESEISRREIQKGKQLTDKEVAQIQGDMAKALGVAVQAKEGVIGAAREKAAGEVVKERMGLDKAEIDALGKAFESGRPEMVSQAVEAIQQARRKAQGEAPTVGPEGGTPSVPIGTTRTIKGVTYRFKGGDSRNVNNWQAIQ
jgi:hypothetical protein